MTFTGKAGLSAVLVAMAVTASTGAFAKGPESGQAFQNFDIDGNGVVTEAEFTTTQQEMFAAIDTNGDGGITKDEMVSHAEARVAASGKTPPAGMLEKRVSKRFEKMDANGDGAVQMGEQQRVEFADIDANGDGSLTEDEFAAMRKARQG